MTNRDKILAWAKQQDDFTSADAVKLVKISRQTVSLHLSNLVREGYLTKEGSTRGARYRYVRGKAAPPKEVVVQLAKKLAGLEEDRVFREVDVKLQLKRKVNKNAYRILSYAFTEMLNNAIDHSRAKTAFIEMKVNAHESSFSIRDHGIGAFCNVQRTFRLKSELDALEHVFKGKQTTAPAAHSGEGIYFTSRIADKFVLRSHRLQATFDNRIKDFFVKETRSLKGTEVQFQIRNQTKKNLTDLFGSFTTNDEKFDKNQIRVKLSDFGEALSRSQAKRLLNGLDEFREVTFDFAGVDEIGQGFADEIFRVYQRKNPQIKLRYCNANSAVSFLISRAMAR